MADGGREAVKVTKGPQAQLCRDGARDWGCLDEAGQDNSWFLADKINGQPPHLIKRHRATPITVGATAGGERNQYDMPNW